MVIFIRISERDDMLKILEQSLGESFPEEMTID